MTFKKLWVLKSTHKIDIVSTFAIIIIPGIDTTNVLGFKGTHKIGIVNVLAIIITFGSDILKVLGFNSIQKNCFKVRT